MSVLVPNFIGQSHNSVYNYMKYIAVFIVNQYAPYLYLDTVILLFELLHNIIH